MRVKRGVTVRRRHKKILKANKGYHATSSRRYARAFEAWMKAGTDAYRERRRFKREMRGLWNIRVNAAARANGLTYSKLMHHLRIAKVELNRKMLSELAINEPEAFMAVVKLATK